MSDDAPEGRLGVTFEEGSQVVETSDSGSEFEDVTSLLFDAEEAVEEHVANRSDQYGGAIRYLIDLERGREPDPDDRAAFERYANNDYPSPKRAE